MGTVPVYSPLAMRCPYLLLLLLPAVAHGTCVVEVKDCDFPFTLDEKEHDRCIAGSASAEPEYDASGDEVMTDSAESFGSVEHYSPVNVEHYCYVEIGKSYVQGVCDSGCFDSESNMPLSFSDGTNNFKMFCKTKSSACQFPFIWEGKNYTSCTNEGSDFYWCAVSVHQDRTIRGKRWGKCDMKTCTGEQIVAEQSGQEPEEDNRIMIIIIVLIVVILLLLIIITALICYCQRRNKRKSLDVKGSESSLEDDCLRRENEKHPLYDELSIPFIDASCPPTPKLEGSYVFTRTGSLRRASRSSSTDESVDK